jgi:hypothetical protein
MFIHPRKNFERRREAAEEAPACLRACTGPRCVERAQGRDN